MIDTVFPEDAFNPAGFWRSDIGRTKSPQKALSGSQHFDVVIVGAGFTGLSAAIALSERGLKTAIVEKSVIGGGASGWNCGQVALDLGLNAPTTKLLFGRERTQIYARLLLDAIASVRALIDRSGQDVYYRENGNLLAGVHESQRSFLEETGTLFDEFGLPVELMERPQLDNLGLPGFVEFALHEKVGGTLHPAKYAYAMADIAKSLGVTIFENSAVHRIDKGRTVRVLTESGSVTAKQAVIAGNAFSAEFGELGASYLPYSVSVMVTKPLTEEQRSRLDWRDEHGMHTAHKVIENIRFTPDGRLLIGTKCIQHGFGTSHPNPKNPKIFASLMRVLGERFPELPDLEPAMGWTGRVALSADTIPYFKSVDRHRNIVAAGGYGGHGIAMSSYSGQILAKMLCDEPLGEVATFVNRKRVPLPPEPLKWLISAAIKSSLEGSDAKTDAALRKTVRTVSARRTLHVEPVKQDRAMSKT